ncbi:MAG: response regulator [Chitinispirillales bacterium]|nr:response regulator [Chitinispirillales bacterium]
MRKKILWVDDEIEFLRSHVMFLETRGYSVTTASNGDEAVRLVGEDDLGYDIVLLDKQMPVKSGNATLDEIKACRPDLPIVMLTGYQHNADIAAGKRYDACLTKPVDPNKLLATCQRVLDAKLSASRKLADKYLRSYTENQTRASGQLSASDWMSLYHTLAKWDVEIDGVGGEGMRQTHTGLKSDCGKTFCGFVAENYTEWIRGRHNRPPMQVDVVRKVIAPELREGRGVLMAVLNGMRLDQFLGIERELRRNFSVSGMKLMSLLPSTADFCVAALASGFYPDEAAEAEPTVFGQGEADPIVMKRLMRRGLERAGADKAKAFYASADGVNGRRHVRSAINAMKKGPAFGVVTVDIIRKLCGGCAADTKPSDPPAIDEAAFRRQVDSWFANSTTLSMMKEACGDSCTVVLTSGHGHVFCRRPSEIYETRQTDLSRRSLFSDRVSVDEREVFLLQELSHFRLPPNEFGAMCLMAREDFYFALHTKGDNIHKPCASSFQNGGISPEEMILPLYVCRPLAGVAR